MVQGPFCFRDEPSVSVTSSDASPPDTRIHDSSSIPETSKIHVYDHSYDPANFGEKERSDENYMISFLSDAAKFTPSAHFKYPVRNGRRYIQSWEADRPWLRYSVKNDSCFCSYCLCFASSDEQSPFVTDGFKNWKKAIGKKDGYLDKHAGSAAHITASQRAKNFLRCVQNAGEDINAKLCQQEKDAQIRTKKGLLSIIDVVLVLGQRGVALRGNWQKEIQEEDGNFNFFMNWKAKYDTDLANHLGKASKAAKYTSPHIQNEIIELCQKEIRERIIKSIPQYWSLLADETQDSSTSEQISICIRYVKNNEVHEDFLGFVKTEKMDAKSVANKLLSTLREWGLQTENMVGQGYDGAAVMSSDQNGVQAKIRQHCKNAVYVHCRSHVLALALAAGCRNIPPIRNMFDKVEKLTWFLSGSAKRKEIFLEVDKELSKETDDHLKELLIPDPDDKENKEWESSNIALKQGLQRRTVPKFCATRWTARVYTLSALIAKYPSVLAALEMINNESRGEAAKDADTYIRLMTDGHFVVCLFVAHFVLSFCAAVTKTLQAENCDIAKAYKDVQLSKQAIANARSPDTWGKLWDRITSMAKAIDVTINKPRTTVLQRHRANATSENSQDQSAIDYYRINVFYTFVDHVLLELDTRFEQKEPGLIAADVLVPSNLDTLEPHHVSDIQSYYGKFLQKDEDLEMEIEKWKAMFKGEAPDGRPKDAASALSLCDHDYFPALRRVFTIFLTTPVGSVACERSFSALRRLKLWTRSSMAENRLSGLALMLVHRQSDLIPSPEDIYKKKSNWRLLLK